MAALLLGAAVPPVSFGAGAADAPGRDPEVAKGIAEGETGEYDSAILRLDRAAQRLSGQTPRRDDAVQAYVYLAVAYLAKGLKASARSRFRDALALDGSLRLSPETFSPRVVEAFEEARSQTAPSASPSAGPLLRETFSGLTPGTNQFFELAVKGSGRLQVTLDWETAGHDLDVYLSTPVCASTSAYPPDACPILARAESPTAKPEVLRVPITPGPYRIVVSWCGDPRCGTGTEAGVVSAVLLSP